MLVAVLILGFIFRIVITIIHCLQVSIDEKPLFTKKEALKVYFIPFYWWYFYGKKFISTFK